MVSEADFLNQDYTNLSQVELLTYRLNLLDTFLSDPSLQLAAIPIDPSSESTWISLVASTRKAEDDELDRKAQAEWDETDESD